MYKINPNFDEWIDVSRGVTVCDVLVYGRNLEMQDIIR